MQKKRLVFVHLLELDVLMQRQSMLLWLMLVTELLVLPDVVRLWKLLVLSDIDRSAGEPLEVDDVVGLCEVLNMGKIKGLADVLVSDDVITLEDVEGLAKLLVSTDEIVVTWEFAELLTKES